MNLIIKLNWKQFALLKTIVLEATKSEVISKYIVLSMRELYSRISKYKPKKIYRVFLTIELVAKIAFMIGYIYPRKNRKKGREIEELLRQIFLQTFSPATQLNLFTKGRSYADKKS